MLVQLVEMSSKQQVADGIELSQSTECNVSWYHKQLQLVDDNNETAEDPP